MKRPRALSLVEVIFTVSVLALVFMVLLNVLPTSILSVRKSEHRLTAGSVAQAVLDECRSAPFEYWEADNSYDTASPAPVGPLLQRCRRTLADGVVFEPKMQVGPVTGSGAPRATLAQIRVTVVWTARNESLSLVRELRLSPVLR